ncbi:MAG: hypothetical protein E7243_21360 [Lacrimispora celerecrescens]|uniref:hypothetical protein n=1 Tax=Lacrimispora indolis TaxID=69825 RepID=UPI000426213B|nr:hypothetical protein [[Clostridium] methoxybenzovorans]MBE7722038.1 hypothetical protein [Lacrimispora celerecrescens]
MKKRKKRLWNRRIAVLMCVVGMMAALTACSGKGGISADSQATAGETVAPEESSSGQNDTRSEKTDDNDLKQEQENQALETASENHSEPIEKQLDLISENVALWWGDDDILYGRYGYSVTDFNQNGRLEIIASTCQGSGLYTRSSIWEVNESMDGLLPVENNISEGDSEADIITESVPVYYDAAASRYYFIFDDAVRAGGAAYYYNKRAVWLENGFMKQQYLASQSMIFSDGSDKPVITSEDADGHSITEDQYNVIADTFYGDLEKRQASLFWIEADDISEAGDKTIAEISGEAVRKLISKSWDGFQIK